MRKQKEKNIISEIFKGEFLSKKENQQHLPFILFVVGLIIINITLYYNAENLALNISKAQKELYELRVEYITTKSELMKKYKRSNIEEIVKNIGLRSSLMPPKIIEKN
jgi:Mn2+/Fe2+ NRAMP family transporter